MNNVVCGFKSSHKGEQTLCQRGSCWRPWSLFIKFQFWMLLTVCVIRSIDSHECLDHCRGRGDWRGEYGVDAGVRRSGLVSRRHGPQLLDLRPHLVMTSEPPRPTGSAITATEQPYVSDIHQTSSKHDWNWFCVVNSSHSWHYGAPVCSTLARFKCNEFGDALFPQNDDYFLLFFPPPTSYDHIVDASCVHFRVGLQYTSACT